MTESLDSVTEIFNSTEEAEFAFQPVRDADVAEFSDAYRRFKRRLGDSREHRYWRRVLRALGYYRFEILASPLPFDSPVLEPDQRSKVLQKSLSRLSQLYPQQCDEAKHLVGRFEELIARSDAPLLSSITESLQEREVESAALVVSEPRLVDGVAEHISISPDTDGVTVLSPRELVDQPPFAEMYLVGRMSWFPPWIARAPRAGRVTLVSYAGVRASVSPGPLLDGEQQGRPIAPVQMGDDGDAARDEAGSGDDGDLDDLEIRPELDLEAIADRMRHETTSASDGRDSDEFVTAQPIELERDRVVFFESDDSTAWVIDLDEAEDNRVRSLAVEAVEPGLYILLRTEGGGDVLIPIADELLGDEAERLRRLQEEWKSALRDYVHDAGLRRTVRDLREAGCSVASRFNVRRWTSPSRHVIKTKSRRDFEALVDIIGLGDADEDYWKAMVAIRDMHLRAGQVIRERLLDAVTHADLNDLSGRGVVRFELAEADAGQLTAFRVRSVPDRTVRLPRGRLREVLRSSIV